MLLDNSRIETMQSIRLTEEMVKIDAGCREVHKQLFHTSRVAIHCADSSMPALIYVRAFPTIKHFKFIKRLFSSSSK